MDFDRKFLEFTDCFGAELNPSECRIQLGEKLVGAGGRASQSRPCLASTYRPHEGQGHAGGGGGPICTL